MAGAADAAFDGLGVFDAGEDGGNPVGKLDPGIGGFEDGGGGAAAVEDFGPEPLGGVGVAALGDEVRADFGGEGGDLGGFFDGGVVLPEPAVGGEVTGPFFVEGERGVGRVNGDGAGAGGVHAEADHLAGVEAFGLFGLGEGELDGFFEAEEVVGGILAGEVVVLGIEEDALRAAGVVDDAGAELGAVAGADDEGADGVGAVINAEGEHG